MGVCDMYLVMDGPFGAVVVLKDALGAAVRMYRLRRQIGIEAVIPKLGDSLRFPLLAPSLM